MADPLIERAGLDAALDRIAAEAKTYLASLDARPVRIPNADAVAAMFDPVLPEAGVGTDEALAELVRGSDAAIGSAGPRFFHWVIGGGTPAALAADWYASAIDQNAYAPDSSPIAARLETIALDWLKQLFGLPRSWGGVLTTGATMANFVGLAAARRWWALRLGVDVDDRGFAGLPAAAVFSSGYIHPSATKALAMLGLGRASVRRFSRDPIGRLDLGALEAALLALGGKPAIVIGNAGEVNAGDFDPIDRLADLCERYAAWLHVDGAFGLFARLSPRTERLVEGIERAHSVISDGHKWLNVPYENGFAFVRDGSLLAGPFGLSAAYLPTQHPEMYGTLGPESSRRARSLAVWATLRAYGRAGYRAMVERHLDLAQRVARRVDEAPDLERLADVPLNIVCFRYRPPGLSDADLEVLNERLGREVLSDGRVYVGTTRYGGRVAFRPAIVNWRTTEADVDLMVDVVRELGARIHRGTPKPVATA